MYTWTRPADMSRHEPTEEAIWAFIDSHDPKENEDIDDRIEQHNIMLKDRNIYGGFFVRSSLLPSCTLDLSIHRVPLRNWVTNIKLTCGEYNPLETTVDSISHGCCDTLQPASDAIQEVISSRLLGHRQLDPPTADWPRDSQLGRSLKTISGYSAWARYVLRAHKEVLKHAGIYEAVYASMFSFDNIPPRWIMSMIEFWDPTLNTCWIGPEELTITLNELQIVSGLPVFGRRYEECIPPDEELFQRQQSAVTRNS